MFLNDDTHDISKLSVFSLSIIGGYTISQGSSSNVDLSVFLHVNFSELKTIFHVTATCNGTANISVLITVHKKIYS